MAEKRNIVKFWRGTRDAYNTLGTNKQLDYSTRYTVIESDGRRSEYFGAARITQMAGQLYPVLSVVESLPSTLNVGDRYLVGHDKTVDADGNTLTEAEYYIVEIAADMSQSVVNPLGYHSIRVIDRSMFEYQLVNGILTSYDEIIDCGTF